MVYLAFPSLECIAIGQCSDFLKGINYQNFGIQGENDMLF